MNMARDHGGGLDAAIARYGGSRATWLDLSTGINPQPYPLPQFAADSWTALPDKAAFARLHDLARGFWGVPAEAGVLAATGASAIIAALPRVFAQGEVCIPGPTYNEHEAAFRAAGWTIGKVPRQALVAVHPNNPDGAIWRAADFTTPITIIDESFCDVMPERSLVHLASRPNTLVLKSFGKFWGLAGLRLGFAIGDPAVIARLADILGPWQVSGPALTIGAEALADPQWADATRARLAQDADRLDHCLAAKGATLLGGTSLFRLYQVDDAARWQDRLAKGHVWSRVFPYARDWLRLGLPAPDRWAQLEAAL
ncbi:threonine-phosphate decarboxylase [Yoonia vestfoldensis]|jgi:cobalamin biosynthetic protein CobC|uniref:Aminotransferase n=1 Tax=Yoonia vestfoldensis TaxID=245188 RepID=A0A1Y0E8C1_9RHOB|nr:threonine-phosphate decarboxylase [Yoonia vestfoldensis]ART99668.1 histidinol-phosphate aminotransferase [Yoonia vestfoldensis]